MTFAEAAELISNNSDLGARICHDRVEVTVYGRPAGYVTADELDRIGHTSTGWGKHLSKGASKVWTALAS